MPRRPMSSQAHKRRHSICIRFFFLFARAFLRVANELQQSHRETKRSTPTQSGLLTATLCSSIHHCALRKIIARDHYARRSSGRKEAISFIHIDEHKTAETNVSEESS